MEQPVPFVGLDQRLPNEMLLHIFEHVQDPADMRALSMTSSSMHAIATLPHLWERFCYSEPQPDDAETMKAWEHLCVPNGECTKAAIVERMSVDHPEESVHEAIARTEKWWNAYTRCCGLCFKHLCSNWGKCESRSSSSTGCEVYFGACGDCFHAHCIARRSKECDLCPRCKEDWIVTDVRPWCECDTPTTTFRGRDCDWYRESLLHHHLRGVALEEAERVAAERRRFIRRMKIKEAWDECFRPISLPLWIVVVSLVTLILRDATKFFFAPTSVGGQ